MNATSLLHILTPLPLLMLMAMPLISHTARVIMVSCRHWYAIADTRHTLRRCHYAIRRHILATKRYGANSRQWCVASRLLIVRYATMAIYATLL